MAHVAVCSAPSVDQQGIDATMLLCRDQEQYTSVHPKNSGSYTRCVFVRSHTSTVRQRLIAYAMAA